MTSYWFASRPKGVEHRHPFLVFDSSDHLHFLLTVFGKEASYRLSPKTVFELKGGKLMRIMGIGGSSSGNTAPDLASFIDILQIGPLLSGQRACARAQ